MKIQEDTNKCVTLFFFTSSKLEHNCRKEKWTKKETNFVPFPHNNPFRFQGQNRIKSFGAKGRSQDQITYPVQQTMLFVLF